MSRTAASPAVLGRLSSSGPLRIGVLVSATGANLRTLIALQQAEPDHFQVCLIASHGSTSAALGVGAEYGIESWAGDFDARCGRASEARDEAGRTAYRDRARHWHDQLDSRIAAWEEDEGPLDLVVLAYHRWVEGNLLSRYDGRMINQHPGDLAVLDDEGRRVLIGNDPVRRAIELGHSSTRTSCFLVDSTYDGGAVLCQGPAVPLPPGTEPGQAAAHELTQKRLSDRPCLEWAVRAFGAGSLQLSDERHRDGSRIVVVDGTPMPLGGMKLPAKPEGE
ncbi:hypothetical protein OG217_09140 [Streptomyces sp. NBC_01023]|uniref:hypothetical protein n=1 Tax=unclassified Streptomyces TaxID=2593676 RepID=UPI0030E2458C|nr:hypothetical protein OG217_09140 [Streptomyces sp. NBC_01023]